MLTETPNASATSRVLAQPPPRRASDDKATIGKFVAVATSYRLRLPGVSRLNPCTSATPLLLHKRASRLRKAALACCHAQTGSKIVTAINTTTVIVVFLCSRPFGREYLPAYTAFSATAVFCELLIAQFFVAKVRFTFENKISVRRSLYFSRRVFVGVASLWRASFSLTHNNFNGFSIIAALLLGVELCEFRRMQRINARASHKAIVCAGHTKPYFVMRLANRRRL
jgi:hypothetical protein